MNIQLKAIATAVGLCTFLLLASASNTVANPTVQAGHPKQITYSGSLPMTPAQIEREKSINLAYSLEFLAGRKDLLVGDYENAALHFRKALATDVLYQFPAENLAYCYLGLNNKPMALKILHDALYHNGKNLFTSDHKLRAYITYSMLECEIGNWQEAATAFDLAGSYQIKIEGANLPTLDISFIPSSPNPSLLLSASHIILGWASWSRNLNNTGNSKYEHSLTQMKAAIKLEPNWAVAWFYYAEVLKYNHNYKQETAAFNKAIRLAGNDKTLIHDAKAEM